MRRLVESDPADFPRSWAARRRRASLRPWGLALAAALAAAPAAAQTSSLYRRDVPPENGAPLTLDQGSWTYIPLQPPREIKKYDIINVRVDVAARMLSEGESERRKNALYDAVLKDWILLNGLKSVKPSPQSDGDPRVKGELAGLYRAESELETSESLRFEIAARVMDIRPNGDLVLEAHQVIHNNNETWEYSLSGVCRREDIQPGNVVLSRNIYALQVDKRERGHVRDGYRRGWFMRWFDQFNPF